MYREPSVMGRKWPQINGLDQKEKINIQPEKNEETRIQKKRRGLGTSRTTLNIPTSKSGVPEGEEEEQEIENLFEQIMKENFHRAIFFPIWQRKETSRKSRKLRESQRSWTQGSTHEGTS